MKFINLELNPSCNLLGIPCEILLYIGKLSKLNTTTYLYIQTQNEKQNASLYNSVNDFLSFYKIKNVIMSNENIRGAITEKLPLKLDMYFYPALSEKNIQFNSYMSSFILAYEKLFGNLPFYSQKDKYCEKFLFINDVILKFGADINLH